MNKKIWLPLMAAMAFAVVLIPAPLSAAAGGPYDSFSMFLARAGYFVSADSAYTDVYNNGLVYGAELRIGGKKFAFWAEGTTRSETGSLTYTLEKTDLSVVSFEGGLLYRVLPGTLSPYLGAGLGYFMFQEKSEPMGVAKQNKIGFCLVGGASWLVGKGFAVDIKLKYGLCKMKPADLDIEVGGFTAGLGIGFRF